MPPEPWMNLAWGVLLFASGLALGYELFGDRRPVRQRVSAGLIDVTIAVMAAASLLQLSSTSFRTALAIEAALIAAAVVVTIWPARRPTS